MEVMKPTTCKSNLMEVKHNQDYLKCPEHSFVFLLTNEDSTVYYGICVHKKELIEVCICLLSLLQAYTLRTHFAHTTHTRSLSLFLIHTLTHTSRIRHARHTEHLSLCLFPFTVCLTRTGCALLHGWPLDP